MAGFRITHADLSHLSGAERTLARQKMEKAEHIKKGLVVGGALAGGGFFGWLQGRKAGMPSTISVPWDLAAGAVFMGLGFANMGGWEYLSLGVGVGSGVWGVGNLFGALGAKMRKDAKDTPGTPFSSADPSKDPNNKAGVDPRMITAGGVPAPLGANAPNVWSQAELRSRGLVP